VVDSHERVHKAILCPKHAWDWVASKTSPRHCNRIVIAITNFPFPLPRRSSRYGDPRAGRPEIFLRHCVASMAKYRFRFDGPDGAPRRRLLRISIIYIKTFLVQKK